MRPLSFRLALALVCGLVAACGSFPIRVEWRAEPGPEPTANAADIESEVYRRAELERSEFFEREVERLRADLRQAEESIVAMESGLRGSQSRADAVSSVAEARIALDRVRRQVPWRTAEVQEARTKLAEAQRQLDGDHAASALFFASRAQRITDSLLAEARQVAQWSDRRWTRGDRVNLRAGPSQQHRVVDVLVQETPVFPERAHEDWRLVRTPSGQVGWVHASLLRAR